MSVDETRLLKVLGDFEKKILCEMKDIQMSVDNSITIMGHRIDVLNSHMVRDRSDFETEIKNLDFSNAALMNNFEERVKKLEIIIDDYRKNRFSSDYNDFQIRFEKIEKELAVMQEDSK
ncbi:MAG: hypothetical protein DRP09_14540 [Candidatus Thorarchaeota archaeon]|nr:MAG: hypothetical protein DRP09_14540 [Candidatus Thorarchaeota archaeon]